MTALTQFYLFLLDVFRSRRIIAELTKRDIRTRYLGSYLGLIWAFVQPMVTILIFWFVFEVGFRSTPVNNFPFILWIATGMIPWFFFSECLAGGTNSIIDNAFLVKKVVFRVSILPIVKIASALLIHLVFLLVLFLMFALYGYGLTLYHLQIFYYLFAMLFFNLGLAWISSSLIIFLKDVGQIIGMMLQFGFWITPIFWSIKMIPEKYQGIIMLNPVYYLIEGYRDCFIHGRWFWEQPGLTIYFWALAIIIFVWGAVLFRKLRPHFADVL